MSSLRKMFSVIVPLWFIGDEAPIPYNTHLYPDYHCGKFGQDRSSGATGNMQHISEVAYK